MEWTCAHPGRFRESTDRENHGDLENIGSAMHFTRLSSGPFPNDGDVAYCVTIRKIAYGNSEISFGALPAGFSVKDSRIIGHGGEDDVGFSFYDAAYRDGKGCMFINGNGVGANDRVAGGYPSIAEGSVVTLRWSAATRLLSVELDGSAVDSETIPEGDYVLGATCDGPGTALSAPFVIAPPPKTPVFLPN